MLSDFSVMRDFYDGFNFVPRKENIVDKNSKKHQQTAVNYGPTRSYM